jgi:hypothetical protein
MQLLLFHNRMQHALEFKFEISVPLRPTTGTWYELPLETNPWMHAMLMIKFIMVWTLVLDLEIYYQATSAQKTSPFRDW